MRNSGRPLRQRHRSPERRRYRPAASPGPPPARPAPERPPSLPHLPLLHHGRQIGRRQERPAAPGSPYAPPDRRRAARPWPSPPAGPAVACASGTDVRPATARRARPTDRAPRTVRTTRAAAEERTRSDRRAPAPVRRACPRTTSPSRRPRAETSEAIQATTPNVIRISTTPTAPRTSACRKRIGPPSSRTTRRPHAILPSDRPWLSVSTAIGAPTSTRMNAAMETATCAASSSEAVDTTRTMVTTV